MHWHLQETYQNLHHSLLIGCLMMKKVMIPFSIHGFIHSRNKTGVILVGDPKVTKAEHLVYGFLSYQL